LGKRYSWGLDVLEGEAPSQLVYDFLEGCTLASQSPRERSVLMASFFATWCLRALPCGNNLCASFSTKARKLSGAVSRCLAASSQMGRENELIGRPAKLDRTAAEPLKLQEARVAHVDQGYFCRVHIPACDLSETFHDNRDSKLGVLRSLKLRSADEVGLDDEVTVPSRQMHADGFVYDPAITRKERYRLTEILRRRGDVEQHPHLSRICLCGKVKTERRIVQRLGSKFKEPGLCSGGEAILVVVQILFGQADTLQQGRGINIALQKRGNRPSRDESGRCRQQAGGALRWWSPPCSLCQTGSTLTANWVPS
jgi:hypothetical protein